MAWFEKRLWTRRRVEPGREALAASLEEMAARGELSGEDWETAFADDEPEEERVIIPPRLRLQSRQWPVVRVDTAHQDAQKQLPRVSNTVVGMPEPQTTQSRRLGRSTRVRLQAVRADQAQGPITERVPALEACAGVDEQKPVQGPAERQDATALQPLHGSGVIKQGQEEVTVSCAQVSLRSVVMVMLTGNPGPVVVQYVTLYPHVGFTFHLSAPAVASTPFNYLFWPCEKEA